MTDLYLRKITHSQAPDNYRVIMKDHGEEIELGSIGIRNLTEGRLYTSSHMPLDNALRIGTSCPRYVLAWVDNLGRMGDWPSTLSGTALYNELRDSRNRT